MNTTLPETWALVRIGNLVERVESQSPADGSSEDFHYIDISSVDNLTKSVRSPSLLPVSEAPSRARQVVLPDDVLVSTVRPALNAVAIVPDNLNRPVASTGFCVLRAKPALLNPKYLFYFVVSEFFVSRLVNCQKGGSYPAVTDGDVLAQLIPLPPLSEQQRIVDILQEAEEIRRLRAQAEAKTAELGAAIFASIFGAPASWGGKIKLGDMVRIVGGGTPSKSVDHFFTGSIPWATSKDVKKLYLDDTQDHVTEEAIQSSATNLVPKGTLLVVVKSKILAHSLPMAITEVPMCFGQDLKGLIPHEGIAPEFLLYALHAQADRVLSRARGANTEGLTLEALKSLPLPNPDSKLISLFVKSCAELKELCRASSRSGRLYSASSASLSAHAFTGKLTEQWRAARPKLLAKEARKRDDELDVAAGKPILINFSAADPEDEADVWQQVPGISREQWLLLFQIRAMNLKKELPRYFTAELIADQIKGPLHRHPQAIESHLNVFAVRGMVIPVSRARDAVPGKPFAAGYRLPMNEEGAAPEQRDDVKAERMKHQRTRAAGKR